MTLPSSPAALRLSVLVPALCGILSCSDSGEGLSEPSTGTLEVTTTTAGVEIDPDGYTLQLNSESPQPIGSAATWRRQDLAQGSHTIALSGLAANCVVEGDNPRSAAISAGETTTINFVITCKTKSTTGSIRVTAATGGPLPNANGYVVTFDGEQYGNIGVFGEVRIVNLTPGTHTIGLGGIAGNCVVAGENPRAVTVMAGTSAAVDFAVTCQSPPVRAGAIDVVATTSGSGTDADGYQFQVDGGGTQSIASNGIVTVRNLAVGPHSVQLTGVADHCSVRGDNPGIVSVTDGGTAMVDFRVTCPTTPTGTLEISTTTTGSDVDADGYFFYLSEVGLQSIPSNATVTIGMLAPGNYTVLLTSVARNCVVQGSNPRAVTVTEGNTTAVPFAVACTTKVSQLALVTQPSVVVRSGVAFTRQPGVRLEDGDGRPVATSGVSVVASLASGAGTLGGTTTVQTDPTGQAAYTDLVITGPAGDYTIRFEAPGSGYAGVTSETVRISSSTSAYQMTELDFLPRAINQVGHIAGTRGHYGATAQAVIWRDGVSTNLGTLGGASSRAAAINNQDVVVGASTTATGEIHGFLWDGTMHDLGVDFVPTAINDAGQMVGGGPGHPNQVFRSGDETISMGGCNAAFPAGLNNLGQVVGQWFNDEEGEPRVCIWDDGAIQDLGMDEGRGTDINEHGSVVGVIDNFPGTIIAFYWRNGVETFLPTLGGIANRASAINDSEIIVGISGEDPDPTDEDLYFPVVWKDGVLTKLSEEYGAAHDINNAGWIVGVITPQVNVVPGRGVLWRPTGSGN